MWGVLPFLGYFLLLFGVKKLLFWRYCRRGRDMALDRLLSGYHLWASMLWVLPSIIAVIAVGVISIIAVIAVGVVALHLRDLGAPLPLLHLHSLQPLLPPPPPHTHTRQAAGKPPR